MPVIEVPAGLPCPQTSTVTPVERRLLSEGEAGPINARTIELDERQFQTFTWMLSSGQAAIFRDWYREVLYDGGAWFAAPATWPTPEGLVVKVRRFLGGPQWTYAGNGYWRLSITAEVRGETELPMAPEEAASLWLDTFTGATATDLSSHSQDIPLADSIWQATSMFSAVQPRLTGDGYAAATPSEDGLPTEIVTVFNSETGVQLVFPFTLNIEMQGIWRQEDIESTGYGSTFRLETYSSSQTIDVVWEPGVATLETDPVLRIASGFTSIGDFTNLLENADNTISLLIEADGITPTINGVQSAKVEVEPESNVYRFVMLLGSAFSAGQRVPPLSLVSRTELVGTVAS